MAFLNEERFSFISSALPEDAFGVISFSGREGLSMCYEFNVDLVAGDANIDLTNVLQHPARFIIRRPEGDIPFHGILARFDQLHAYGDYVFYRAVLVPKLWWLSLTNHNQIFLNASLPEILNAVLKDGGLTSMDFELRLRNDYPDWEYVCQYRESHLSFVSRWLERDGIYYYFEQNEAGEKVIFTDTNQAHAPMPDGRTMHYSPPSGLDETHREEVIQSLICRQKMLPEKVMLKDYNYRTPSLEINGQSQVRPNGRGLFYDYGDHFRTPAEGDRLASIRAEEFISRERLFLGQSTVPYLRPGYTFSLEDHFRSEYDQDYLTIEIGHQGSQTGYLLAGLKPALTGREKELYYQNDFTAIPADRQFRPERKTDKARIYGALNARIDASGSGKYAELDDQGRYKVILPFDLSGRQDGKASAWVRMMQPYQGADHGMHFPLHKGAEVLLSFIAGDPDRPVIAGAIPNPENPSLLTDKNQTMAGITTSGGNKIHIEDQEGRQRILLHSPTQDSFLRVGAPNDPGDSDGNQGIKLYTNSVLDIRANATNSVILGESSDIVGGSDTEITAGAQILAYLLNLDEVCLGLYLSLKMGGEAEFTPHYKTLHGDSLKVEGQLTKLSGAVTDLKDDHTELVGEVHQLVNNHVMLVDEVIELAGQTSTLAQETNSLVFNVNRLANATNTLVGDVTTLGGTHTEVVGSELTAIENSVGVVNINTRAIANDTRVIGTETNTSATRFVTSGLHILM